MADEAGTGAEDTAGAEGAEDGADAGDLTPPSANTWWNFESKDSAEKWANDLVTKRLARERKTKLDPIAQERDTLRAEVERLKPLESATLSDAEKRFEDRLKAQDTELAALRARTAAQDRKDLVRSIADTEGLPAAFLARVRGDDEDAIRDDIKDLLNGLSEVGTNTGKKTPPAKAPKPANGNGGSVSSGGGSNSEETSDDELSKSIIEEVNKQRRNGGLRATVRRR